MTNTQLAHFKVVLEAQREELESEIRAQLGPSTATTDAAHPCASIWFRGNTAP